MTPMTRLRSAFIIGLAAATILASGCKRPGIEEPSPFGPSSFSLTFEVEARPNVVLATDVRPMSEIRATVKRDGKPVKDQVVYFTILAGPGQFGDYTLRTVVATNAGGVAAVMFIGPTKFEIDGDLFTTIKVQLETSTPDYIYKQVDVRILRSLSD
jgi:hypothetical protein